mmetsp:Transcript_27038/g.56324  ORF Transcript_27038/g.56324 Transcript_27038/m.56324 type:complete len:168 (+) Transcript_27038:187-690(+)|eukprot:CAMPEP_0196153892 /NCGR_PEP_ID=MMETSP0910-20130528/38004_1 /TAXON_ID=49265 /ORGANISM="Thalassiosira rotula, Strain GSO102" /LENGTH=167 /DNA_ID=CAMNT_0041417801 /DNA_START=69 /DNA_END=572 /DNA_ORIENTATION=+
MVDSTPLISGGSNKKQGHRVLCCCDSRKATIFVATPALVLSIIALVSVAIDGQSLSNNAWTIATFSLSILFYILVIWGAIRYHSGAVIVSVLWEIASIVLLIITAVQYPWSSLNEQDKQDGAWILGVQFAWRLLVIYAEGTFVSELSRGIMSAATHSREKYSCCCNV